MHRPGRPAWLRSSTTNRRRPDHGLGKHATGTGLHPGGQRLEGGRRDLRATGQPPARRVAAHLRQVRRDGPRPIRSSDGPCRADRPRPGRLDDRVPAPGPGLLRVRQDLPAAGAVHAWRGRGLAELPARHQGRARHLVRRAVSQGLQHLHRWQRWNRGALRRRHRSGGRDRDRGCSRRPGAGPERGDPRGHAVRHPDGGRGRTDGAAGRFADRRDGEQRSSRPRNWRPPTRWTARWAR